MDKRNSDRLEIFEYAIIEDQDSQTASAVIVDLSLGGMQVRTRDQFMTEESVRVQIYRSGLQPIIVKAEVRYCRNVDDDGMHAVGLRFRPEGMAQRIAIVDFVHGVFKLKGESLLRI